ncbi:MAG TPA: hypothetical protein VHI13_12160 [Candidatus Kapabacteria bacterium]|nr:hypothetical protein [Candidatus Kapabacteria bacterium]
MAARISILVTVLILMFAAVTGCADRCAGVMCSPAPTPLQVVVGDTISVDTQIVVLRGTPPADTTVDTVLVFQRPTAQAVVTLWRVQGVDTVAFDTLRRDGYSYYRQDVSGLPAPSFIVRAERGTRHVSQSNLTVRHVDGCCPYDVVGYYTLALPLAAP